jgi:NRPS condensation-like uncharacterized protein
MWAARRIPATVIDLAVAFCSKLGNIVVQLEVVFDHRLDEQRLAEAFIMLQEAHPVLGCRLVIKTWQGYWEELPREQRNHLIVVHDSSAYEAFRSEALSAERGPQVHACLFHDGEDDRLLLKITHEASDAGGLKETSRTLAEIYNRLLREPTYRPVSDWNAQRGLGQVLRRIPPSAFPRIFADLGFFRETIEMARQDAVRTPSATAPLGSAGEWGPHLPYRVVDRERVNQLRHYGRADGATINDLFLAAMFRTIAQLQGSNAHHQLALTVDLRRYLPQGRGATVDDLSGIEFVGLDSDGQDFAKNLRQVVAATRARKKNFIGINGFTALVPLIRPFPPRLIQMVMNMFIRRVIPSAGIPSALTNMGEIRPEMVHFDRPARLAYMFPPPIYPPMCAAGISGHKGAVVLSSGTFVRAGEVSPAERFLDLVLSNLPC